jgi:uncharacterized protein YggU (UPF0235/DUF167 family)
LIERFGDDRIPAPVIRFPVHVHPGSRTPGVGGSHDGALNVRVRARAVEGAATDEVIAALVEAFNVRPGAVACVRGAHSRNKLVWVEGDDEVLMSRLVVLLAK